MNWTPFKPFPNAKSIVEGLGEIPSHWSLTVLQEKSPRRKGWQTEGFIPRAEIARLILHGEKLVSSKGNQYNRYSSGVGLRTGEPSGGLVAIDVDGASAQPLLQAISNDDLSETVTWTSGKPGRYQIVFQIPDEIRPLLTGFNRKALTEWGDLLTDRDETGKPKELLEFRYNRCQSALPPSYHPTTGGYQWINSPSTTPVAIAPKWLCELLVRFATEDKQQEQQRQEKLIKWEEFRKESSFAAGTATSLVEFLEFEVLPRLSPEQIYNWQGHNFRQFGNVAKGAPPWRQSSSGCSFHVWFDSSHNRWAWQDKGIQEGGGAVQYRWKLRGGTGTPTGKDYFEIVAELARDAGLEVPKFKKSEFFESDKKQLKQQNSKPSETRKEQEQKRQGSQQDLQRLAVARNQLTHITEIPYKVVNVSHMGEVLKDLVEPGTINIVVSDTGTGKSESIIDLAREADAVYSWHNRISLGKMLSLVLGLNYKDDVSRNNKKKAAFCSPSAYQFDPRHLSNRGLLLLDETDQVLDFNFGSLCNKDGIRPLILSTLEAHFESVIAGKGIALCMSADITQKEINYLKAIAPEGTPVRLIVNKYQPKRPDIYHDPSSTPDGLVDKLLQKLGNRTPCFALDDMKNGVRGCKSLAEFVRSTMPEIADMVLEIHADNSNDPRVQAFFKNPDEESKKYLLIVCSPSVVSGLSMKNKRFINGVFGFCNGILIDREIKQFLNRVRGAEDIHLWIAEEGFPVHSVDNELTTPEEIKAYYQRNYEPNSKHILGFKPEYDPIREEWSSPHFDLFCKNLAYRIITMKDLRQFTLDHLREIGYGIVEEENIPQGGTQAIEDRLKKIWQGIEIAEAEAIAAARFLSQSEMEALDFSTETIPPEILPSYRKTKLRDYFGEELIAATTFKHKSKRKFTGYAAMALKNARGDYGRQLEAFYLLNQDISESIARDIAAEHRQEKRGHGRFAGDIRWNTRKHKCRESLGLIEFLKPDQWWEPKDYKPMVEKAKQYSRHVKDALGLNVENITDGQIFGELMRQVGLSFETKSVQGERWKLRKIKDEDWQYTQMFVRHKQKLKEVTETVPEATATTGFNANTLAEVLSLVETKQEYEELIRPHDKELVDAALALVAVEVRDRINAFYEPQAKQLTLEDVATNCPQHIGDIEHTVAPELVLVDEEIKASSHLCDLKQITPVELWTRRLNRALLMARESAKKVYTLLPQQILHEVWGRLTYGVQAQYSELFAT